MGSLSCENFICMYGKAECHCTITKEQCTREMCRETFSKCRACIQESCIFKIRKEQTEPVVQQKEESKEIVEIKEEKKVYREGFPYAYVDGSYNPCKKVFGYGGFVELGDGSKKHILKGCSDDEELVSMRNVAGEIAGAEAAIRYAMEKNLPRLYIYYDYLGIEKWATHEWKANKYGTMRYQELCDKCKVELIFKKVKGHSGIDGNELADRLAKESVGAA